MFGSPLALVPAAALAGFRGIEWVNWKGAQTEVITLEFDQEEIIYANTGTLFQCPNASQLALPRPISKFFNVLDLADAREMVALMSTDNVFEFCAA